MPLYPAGVSRIPLRKQGTGRTSLGPPDVYPQDPNQKEDELNAVHVKQGFTQSHSSMVSEEYGSMISKSIANEPVASAKVLADLKSIIGKKEDSNTLVDSGRRKQAINTRDNFWLVTQRNKPAVDNWFRDLAANRRPYSALLKKVPIFNKREEVLVTLRENEVPTSRAVWYVKMCAAYSNAMTEVKTNKKRQVSDPSQEWTHALTRFLKDQLTEILSSSSDDSTKNENSTAHKNWIYTLEMCEYMYNQGLLDRQEFLQWVLEMVEKCKYPDDPLMRMVLPVLMCFAKEFCQNEVLSRKLGYQCARKITYLVSESDAITNSNQNEPNMHPVVSAFLELTNDPYYRFIILGLSSVLQTISMECPSALVWHYFGENKTPSSLLGSPLDHLPNCAPSGLPMPMRQNNPDIRHKIRLSENYIKERSKQVEEKWSVDQNPNGKMGSRVDKNLSVLEVLDGYNFDRIDASNDCLDNLYTKLFTSDVDDDVVVHTLCEWAVTSMRSGEHRCFVAAKLLERRQSELTFNSNQNQPDNEAENPENADKNSESDMYMSNMMMGPPVFQTRLFHYLDTSAPKLENLTEFSNLVLLFYELINHEVFSHDAYLCTLISRGDVMGPITEDSKKSEDAENSFDDSKIDGDLTNILNQIKEGNQLNDPFSPTEKEKEKDMNLPDVSKKGRHWQFVYHFPLPQDENSTHECNQRNVLLYGAGRSRDDASKNVKKIYKDVTKLFSKKFSIDVSDGGKVKKHNKGDVIFEQVIQRFQTLSYYDQHHVSFQCGQTMIEMLSAFSNSSANYLPCHEYVSFLFDLTGLSLNIQGILDWCLQILKELPGVESQLMERGSCLTRTYTTTFALYIVGVLRKYHTIFLLNLPDVVTAFEQLNKIAYRPKFPLESGKTMLDCNSAEWCILNYLYDLASNCSTLKTSERYLELKRHFPSTSKLSKTQCSMTDKKFGLEYIANPKKKVDPLTIKLLIDNPQNQYNLVCNVLMEVCGCNDNEKLNDIAILCCEFTAQCQSLSSEWLGALGGLCNSVLPDGSPVYSDLKNFINMNDQSIYSRVGIFVSVLIARNCFNMPYMMADIGLPCMMSAREQLKDRQLNTETEVGARFSCHLLLMLFQSVENSSPTRSGYGSGIKLSCDRQLLASHVRNIPVGLIIAVLKVILVVGDEGAKNPAPAKIYNIDDDEDDEYDFGRMMNPRGPSSKNEKDELCDFAKHTLKQICSQEWVHNRCLQSTDDLLKNGTLLDEMLDATQAQRLLRLICMQHKNNSEVDVAKDSASRRRILRKILENLDEWNLRISTVDIKLMHHQLSASSSASEWLDAAAGAIVDIFKLSDEHEDDSGKVAKKAKKFNSIWIIPYLVRNLKFLQSRVLKVSSHNLDCGNMFSPGSNVAKKESKKINHGHQPFLQLVLTCLRELDSQDKKQDREEQKETLIQSLHTQLSTYLFFTKDDKCYEDRKATQDALQLRFSLVGGVFDVICRNVSSITDWCTLLVQLIVRGVVDLTNNSDLFTTVLDMINILIHSTLITDRESSGNSERSEETRKHYNYHALVKKLKKEFGEKNSPSLKYLRQLLPIPKMMTEVIVTEPFGLINEKGSKVKGLNCDKKPGMQVAEKQKISPWDVLEGHKTPAPLSWAWFGAVKHERKPMKYEEGFQELKRATIVLEKPKSYYTDPPPLPPEDLEPAFNQNKDGMQNPKDPMGQMGMMGMRGPMGGQMPGQMGGQPYGPGGPGQMMPQHMMGGNPPQMQGYNPAYGGQRMPAYMGGGPQMQGGRMMNPQMSPMGQGGPGGPGGPRGPMMNMNMGMGMPQHMMGPRGARPMNLPPGARPNMMQQGGMYGGPQGGQGGQMMNPGGQGGQQWSQPQGYNSPQQYVQSPYHSPQMSGNNMQRFAGPQGGPQGPQGPQRSLGNPKQALQDMLRARHTDPQFNSNSGFMPPTGGRTSFPMRPSINRMPNTSMYQGSNPQQGPPQQYMNSQGQNYGNFQGQGQGQFYMQQGGQGPPQQRPNYGNQMGGMRPQNQNYPHGGPGGPQGQSGYMGGPGGPGYRPQMNQMQQNSQQQQQQNMQMRMQNPQLMAQLQRGPQGNMGQQQQQQQMNPGYGQQQQNHY